jgi:hypothetical protein
MIQMFPEGPLKSHYTNRVNTVKGNISKKVPEPIKGNIYFLIRQEGVWQPLREF